MSETALPAGSVAWHRSGLDKDELLLTRCEDCQRHHYHPSIVCRSCGSSNLASVTASGRGTVHAATFNADAPDRNVALVELSEGPRVLTTLAEPDLPIETPVEVYFDDGEQGRRPCFRRAS